MRYLVDCLTCLVLLSLVLSPSSASKKVPQIIRKCGRKNTNNDRSIDSWLNTLKCGDHMRRRRPFPRVEYGRPIYPGQFPYAVRVKTFYNENDKEFDYECGGVIIRDRWIMTAASCLMLRIGNVTHPAKVSEVIIGDYSLGEANDGARAIYIDSFVIHPDYDEETAEGDIALLRTHVPIEYDLHARDGGYGAVNEICLPTKDVDYLVDDSKKEVWLFAGWGLNENNVIPDTMLHYQVSLADYSFCKTIWGEKFSKAFNPNHMICTYNKGKKTTLGDSGYGIVRVLDDVRYEIVGIALGGSNGDKGPVFHTNVFGYLDWIKSHVDSIFG